MIVSFLRPLVPAKAGKESSSADSGLDPRFRGDDNPCMLSSLEQSILSTLVYFDMFDYPLTLLELHRWLYRPDRTYSLGEVGLALETSERLRQVVRNQSVFFYLAGREGIIRARQRRYGLSAAKWRRARAVAKFLSHIPFVRMIGISGSLAYHNSRIESDIDLLIITKRGGVWWARFIALMILHLLRLRPGQGGTADKICLSVFADEDNLAWRRLLINQDDVDFVFWLANIEPLYGLDYHSRFWQANQWLKDYLPNIQSSHIPPLPRGGLRGGLPPSHNRESSLKYSIEKLLTPFTVAVRRLQYALFPPAIRSLMNKDTRVRVEDGLLKFHTTDRRQQYAAEFTRKISTFLNDFVV